MVLTLQKTVTEQKQIPVPSFWKNSAVYYALFDDNNLYAVCCFDGLHSVTNYVPSDNQDRAATYCLKDTELITEEQFWSMYQEARLATELEPREKSFTETLSNVIQLKEV